MSGHQGQLHGFNYGPSSKHVAKTTRRRALHPMAAVALLVMVVEVVLPRQFTWCSPLTNRRSAAAAATSAAIAAAMGAPDAASAKKRKKKRRAVPALLFGSSQHIRC